MARLSKTGLFLFLLVIISHSAFAQIYIPPTFPTPPPTTVPTPTTTTTTTTTTPTTTTITTTTPIQTTTGTTVPNAIKIAPTTAQAATTTAVVTTNNAVTIPGYTSAAKSYSAGKTAAYIIAPFAIVAGTYLLGGHHQVEISPNAGFVWPGDVEYADTTGHLRDEGIYGVKVGTFVNENFEVEGNFSYMSHFESRFDPTTLDQSFGIQPRTVYGLLYDVNGTYNFGKSPLGVRVTPYVTGGVGGLTTMVRHGDVALISGQIYQNTVVGPVFNPTTTVVVADNSAFFSFNYGGGIKVINAWGPVGVRADFRGRTFPNFRGESMTWPEATAGLTFTFGER
jgi:hypothetical protein